MTAALLLLLAACATEPPVAESGPGLTEADFVRLSERRFERFDADGNGTVTFAEYADLRLREFARADRNDDGVINRGELRGLEPIDGTFRDELEGLTREEFEAKSRDYFRRVSDDGLLTEAEYVAARQSAFERADRDGDGVLRRGELRGPGPGD